MLRLEREVNHAKATLLLKARARLLTRCRSLENGALPVPLRPGQRGAGLGSP